VNNNNSHGSWLWRENFLQIFTYIIASTAVVFYLDIITPLGFMIWILYFIPLFLTLYVRWRYAPFLAAGVFIILIGTSYFLSPPDISLFYALANRVFFSLMLCVSAVLIWRYNRNVEMLLASEERYRYLIEWSPEAILVYRDGRILFSNPVGVTIFGMEREEQLIGQDLLDWIEPDGRDRVRETFRQAMPGAPIEAFTVPMTRPDGSAIHVEVSGGHINWEGRPAIQVILRDVSDR
jgi:PAS domain S-box-containing protein